MIYGDKQFRELFIATASHTDARATASVLAAGEVQAFNVAGTAVATVGERFKIFKNVGGVISSSAVIDPANVITSKTTDYAVNVNKVMTVTIPTPVVGQSFEARLLVRDWGNTSAQDYVSVYAQFIATSTTASDVATGLAAAFVKSLSFVTTTKVVVTANAATIIATGSNADFKLFQFDGKPVDFEFSLTNPSAVAAVLTTARKEGKGEGHDIAQLEHFLYMVKGDQYANSEISYTKALLADETEAYNVCEISYYDERQIAPGDKQRKVLTIAVPTSVLLASMNGQIMDELQTIGLSAADWTVGAS
jgi:hypothetical protein